MCQEYTAKFGAYPQFGGRLHLGGGGTGPTVWGPVPPAQRGTATGLCVCVCLLNTSVSLAKQTEPIHAPFGKCGPKACITCR